MIAIVDYGAGNVGSVAKAVRHLGFAVEIVSGPEKLISSDKIILPGQGHFESMIRALHESRLYDPLREAMDKGCRYLGICLGLQLLYEGSEEAPRMPGMGLIPGNVQRLQDVFKIPHIGWSQIEVRKTDGLLTGIKSGEFFYFCHSYSAPVGPACIGVTNYGQKFASVVERGPISAVQFHPEKSGEIGLRVLQNFLEK